MSGDDFAALVAAELADPTGGPKSVTVADVNDPADADKLRRGLQSVVAGELPGAREAQ